MTVSIKQLKAFVAVVEEKSFSQAAERLNEKIEARTDLIDREARIRAELSEKNIKVEAKNAEELAEEIDIEILCSF